MPRQLQETKKFTEQENKEILKVLHFLIRKEGYSFSELSRISGVSMGGMIGLRKNRNITPSIANKLASAFEYDGWYQMVTDFRKTSQKAEKPRAGKTWKQMIEGKISQLELEIQDLKGLVTVLTSPTQKNV